MTGFTPEEWRTAARVARRSIFTEGNPDLADAWEKAADQVEVSLIPTGGVTSTPEWIEMRDNAAGWQRRALKAEAALAGGMALTAEQVEDVRKLSQMDPWWSAEHVEDVQARVRAMLPVAVHSGDDRCPEMNVMNDRCCFLLGHDGLHRACGYKWSTAPAEPAEEETKAEYPRTDGDFTVLGPEIFTDASGEFICWKGVNYVRQPDPASSPVVPVPTETGPWQHRDGRICVYVQHLPLTLRYRIGRFNLHGDFVHDDSKRQLPEGFAPFVAAEEGWT